MNDEWILYLLYKIHNQPTPPRSACLSAYNILHLSRVTNFHTPLHKHFKWQLSRRIFLYDIDNAFNRETWSLSKIQWRMSEFAAAAVIIIICMLFFQLSCLQLCANVPKTLIIRKKCQRKKGRLEAEQMYAYRPQSHPSSQVSCRRWYGFSFS